MTLKFDGWPKNNRVPLLYYIKLWASFQNYRWIQTEVTVRKPSLRSKSAIFCLVWPWNLMDGLEKNRATFPYNIKLCASFQSHRWIQTWVTIRKRPIHVKIGDFLSCVTLKFYWWPWRTIEHLFYVSWSLAHHFIAISEFKHELRSGDAQFGSKSMIFCSVWPWNLRKMTFKNNKAPLLCYFKLCALFCSRWWIQTGVTVRKRPIWLKNDYF